MTAPRCHSPNKHRDPGAGWKGIKPNTPEALTCWFSHKRKRVPTPPIPTLTQKAASEPRLLLAATGRVKPEALGFVLSDPEEQVAFPARQGKGRGTAPPPLAGAGPQLRCDAWAHPCPLPPGRSTGSWLRPTPFSSGCTTRCGSSSSDATPEVSGGATSVTLLVPSDRPSLF